MKQVIYETKGRAREYNELACNIFGGCPHGCLYCYSPLATHKTRDQFQHPKVRVTAIDVLKSAKLWKDKGETRPVLLSFTCDPYQQIEQETMITRQCIIALHEVGLNVIILTKGGIRSMRDFDLLTPKDAYAITLTCLSDKDSLYWEPKAALPAERIRTLIEANKMGIKTWVSLEPVIYPDDAMIFVRMLHKVVGHWKISKLNYKNSLPIEGQKRVDNIDWHKFGWDMKELCDKLGIKYYFKTDLLKEMRVNPKDFIQTYLHHH